MAFQIRATADLRSVNFRIVRTPGSWFQTSASLTSYDAGRCRNQVKDEVKLSAKLDLRNQEVYKPSQKDRNQTLTDWHAKIRIRDDVIKNQPSIGLPVLDSADIEPPRRSTAFLP